MAAILSTSFAAPVTDWAATWPLASVTGVQIGHLCVAESELAQVMKVGPATTVTVRRGVEGTASAAHAARTSVAVYRAGEVDTDAPVLGPLAVPLRQATVTLTNAQIKTLPTTAVPIVAAPGTHRLIVPVCGAAVTAFPGAPYSSDPEATWAFYFDSTLASAQTKASQVLGTTDLSIVAIGGAQLSTTDAGPLNYETFGSVPWGSTVSGGSGVNSALVFADFYVGGANYTGGHASNTLTVSVLYGVLDVTIGVFV